MPKKGYKQTDEHTNNAKKSIKRQFDGGRLTWNKGTKGICKSNSGSFKKGDKIRLGKKSSPETIERNRQATLKNPIRYWLGKKRPEMLGEKNWNYKGGVTPELKLLRCTLEYEVWKLEVYKKDKGICRLCKKRCTNKTITAHHLNNFRDFPELRFVVDNGMTLCRSCHMKIHHPRKNET